MCAKHHSCLQGPILAFVYAVKEMLEEGRSTSTDLPVNVAFVFEVGMPVSRLSCRHADMHSLSTPEALPGRKATASLASCPFAQAGACGPSVGCTLH